MTIFYPEFKNRRVQLTTGSLLMNGVFWEKGTQNVNNSFHNNYNDYTVA